MSILTNLFSDIYFIALFAAVIAFVISTRFYLYPSIIDISKIKGLMDEPGERKMHGTQIPTLGGLGVFIAFSICIIGFGLLVHLKQPELIKLLSLLGSAIILLFLGIKDDLVCISPKKKLLGQLIAVVNVVVLTNVRVLSFEGLLGIWELAYIPSVVFSVFVFVLVINAVNLIDGIDGLAASISILASITFGILFLVNGHYFMTLISAILVGSLFGFLRYNLSTDKKIFMGDCGSMLTGFLLAYQGIGLLALNGTPAFANTISNAPLIFLAVLSYPLFDLLRVFAIRIKQGRSPFSADSNHIHHRLLRLGLSHLKATMLLCIANGFIIGFAFLLIDLNINLELIVTVCIGGFIYLAPFFKAFDVIGKARVKKTTTAANELSIQDVKVNDLFLIEANADGDVKEITTSKAANLKLQLASLEAKRRKRIMAKRASEIVKLVHKEEDSFN